MSKEGNKYKQKQKQKQNKTNIQEKDMKQKTPVIFVMVVSLCTIELKINHSSLMDFEIW